MNNERPTYHSFRFQREQLKLKILKQELLIKSSVSDLGKELTFASLKRRFLEKVIDSPGSAFYMGLKAIKLFTGKRKKKR